MRTTQSRRSHASHSNNGLTQEVSKIKDDLGTLRADIGELTSCLLDGGVESVKAARSAVESQLSDSFKRARGSVRSRPMSSLAIAAGLGAVAAWLLTRR